MPAVAALLAAAVVWLGRDTATLATLSRLVAITAWLGVWTAACWGAGGLLVRRHADDRLTHAVLRLASGAMLLSVGATILAWTGSLHPSALQFILAAFTVFGAVAIRRSSASPAPSVPWVFATAMLPWLFLGLLLHTPPVMFDVVHYHLAFPAQWMSAGGFVEFPRHGFSYYWSGHGMAFTFALATVGPWGASAIGWWFGLLAAAAAGALGRRLGGPQCGWWSAALVALTPASLQIGTYASADLPLSAWAGAAALALLRPPGGRPEPGSWGLAGLLVGAAVSAKYLALATVAAPLGIGALVLTRGRFRTALPSLLLLVLGAALIVAPWAARNAIWNGNPVYPYFQEALGGPPSGMDVGVDLAQNDTSNTSVAGAVVRAATAAVWRTFEPLPQGGLFGLAWVILLPVSAMIRFPTRSTSTFLWSTTLSGLIAWGALVHFSRFALPVLVMASPLAGRAAAVLTSHASPAIRRSFMVLLAFLLAWNGTSVATRLNLDRVAVTFGGFTEREFVERWLDYGDILPVLNEALPQDAVILLVGEPRSLYIEREVVIEDSYRLPLLAEWAEEAESTEALARRVADEGITHILIADAHLGWAARLRGSDDFWNGVDADTRRVIAGFLETATEPIAVTDRARLLKVKAPIR
jgi:hypothetical protein